MAKAKEKSEKKTTKTASKTKTTKPKTEKTAKPKTEKKIKADKKSEETKAVAETAAKTETLPKIQCFNHGKKTICANLNLSNHKCMVKTFGHDRMATVRIGKKRRCESYEETTYNG